MKMSGTSEHTAFYIMIKSYLLCPLRERKVRVFPLACGFSPFCFDLQSLKSLFALFVFVRVNWVVSATHPWPICRRSQRAYGSTDQVLVLQRSRTESWLCIYWPSDLEWASLVAQMVNNLPAMQRPGFDPGPGRSPVIWPWPWINDQISWASHCQISCCLVHTLGIRVIESLSQTVRHW